MEYENIILEREGNIAIITMNRPNVLNALNHKMIQELLDALAKLGTDDKIRAVVITGSGRAFCSGDDLKEMGPAPGSGSRSEGIRQGQQKLIKAIRGLRKPVIAAVNGFAHGAGSDLALACDFRIASEEARLGDIRTSRALTIGTGATYLMPQIVGLAKAIELLLTGDTIDAKEAERIGLVNKAVPAGQFRATVMEMASKLASGPTKIIGIAKAEIYRELHMDLASALEDELIEVWTPTQDGEEGSRSFLEKRTPRYTGL